VIAFDEAKLTPAELAELDALLEDVPGEIPLAPLSFRAWIAQADPRFQFYRHVEAEIDLLNTLLRQPPLELNKDAASAALATETTALQLAPLGISKTTTETFKLQFTLTPAA
jgi:hypothetical protein